MDWHTLVLRTIFVYFFILLVMRMMGKREIGKLSLFDLVVSIMIAELAVMSVEDTSTPLLRGMAPIVVLFLLQLGLAYLSLKSERVRHMIDGRPSILVENGEIREEEMKKQRYHLDDLLTQLRENRVHSINDVEFAILEPSGKLSVMPREGDQSLTEKDIRSPQSKMELPAVFIKDGEIQYDQLKKVDKNKFWLKQQLRKRAQTSQIKEISFCSMDAAGEWYIDFKD